MKKLIQFTLILLVIILGLSCINQNKEVLDSKSMLIKEIIDESEKTILNGSEKVVIRLTGYCEKMDCREYFKGYEDLVLLYSKESVFMRGISKVTVIENISSNNTSATIKKVRFSRKIEERKAPEIIKINIW